MMSIDPAAAPRWEPECRYARYAPLASVAMSTEDQVNGVVVFKLIEYVRRMGQQEVETILCSRR